MKMRLCCTIGLVAALADPVAAESLSATTSPMPALELQAVQRALGRSESRQKLLEGEIAALSRENGEISHRLVDTAAMIQTREALADASEDRIAALGDDEKTIRAGLRARSDQLARLLAGLVELEENPPPALAAAPGDALRAVRSAMLFGAAVPAVRTEAGNLARDLSRLEKLRVSLAQERDTLALHLDRLKVSRLQLEELLARKRTILGAADSDLKKEKEAAVRLARKAKSLSGLLAALAAEARRREAEKKEPAVAEATEKPKLAFTDSLGRLAYPAQGQVVRRFGDSDGFGGQAKGFYIATREVAQVVAPSAARVEFAGTFRSYGQLLILDVGEGYHILLAGLDRIEVETGQSVKAGEPVGLMGDSPARGTMIGDQLSDRRPIVYVEFRKAGDAVDPAAWWIGGSREARR
ncbi:MAG TPA: peptidoglycan DD-metalloendopeptidase family protein [Aestuariivirgaceae bacterium]|nr:peptidoglycan DD-metalloendopeptidase family protein [Aestuariivirgaceae bacterium]